MAKHLVTGVLLSLLFGLATLQAQGRTILIPQPVEGAPFRVDDQDDLFGKAFRWFYENEPDSAIHYLKAVMEEAGVPVQPQNYYVVVAHFTDDFAPLGIIHPEAEFFGSRTYGLKENNLFYVFISRTPRAPSFLSVLATAKSSPFVENLPGFLNFVGLLSAEDFVSEGRPTTWVDVRQFYVPKAYRNFSELSFIVKKRLAEEEVLAQAVIDNSKKERWSYGVALGLTSANDVDIIIGSDGRIIVQPKPNADVAAFGVINYHFWPVDTKAKTLGNSLHALAGLRVGGQLEPLVGVGGGVDLGVVDLAVFAGYSVEFANELEEGFSIGQQVDEEVDPFKTKIRGKFRFGLEVKFP